MSFAHVTGGPQIGPAATPPSSSSEQQAAASDAAADAAAASAAAAARAAQQQQTRPHHSRLQPGHGQIMVRGRPSLGDQNYQEDCPQCNPLSVPNLSVQITFVDDFIGQGLQTGTAAIFVAGELAGLGVLAIPWAVANLGWLGFLLMLVFGAATVHTGSCLGTCWLILEERYLQCRQYPCTDPYSVIAFHAVGKKMSYFTTACVQITLLGAGTVYLLLVAQSAHRIFDIIDTDISYCTWLLVFSASVSSLMFLDSPKKHRLVASGAILTTMTACCMILMQICLDDRRQEDTGNLVPHKGFDVNQFFLSYGTILFSYGGATAFPTIQNNHLKQKNFTESVISSFIILTVLFVSVVIGSYVVYGDNIQPNILMTLGDSWWTYIAISSMMCHLLLGFVIIVSPVSRNLEEMCNAPNGFGIKKVVIRVGLLLIMVFFGLSIHNFSNVLTLVGSSTVTLTTFVFPPIFYLRLCSMESLMWPDRSLSWKSKIRMVIIILVGLISGGFAMVTAINHVETLPCWWSSLFPKEL